MIQKIDQSFQEGKYSAQIEHRNANIAKVGAIEADATGISTNEVSLPIELAG